MSSYSDHCLTAQSEGDLYMGSCSLLSDLSDHHSEVFQLTESHQFKHTLTGNCLTASGDKVKLAPCTGNTAEQQWEMVAGKDAPAH